MHICAVWAVAESMYVCMYVCYVCIRGTYLSQLIISLKNTGPTILLALTAHQTPTFTGWSRTL
jgi:hypothetical protein